VEDPAAGAISVTGTGGQAIPGAPANGTREI